MPTTLEQLQYGFDRDSQRTWRQRATTQGWDNAYSYDSLSQVTGDNRGDLNLAQTTIAGVPANGSRWDYDETGNWHGYQTLENGAVVLNQSRTHDKGNRLMEVEGAAAMRTDRAGRMIQSVPGPQQDWSQSWQITWDAWSRITQVSHTEGNEIHRYEYDGITRRITRTNDQTGVTLRSYYNDGWRPVEERKNSETTASASSLWGARHRDDLVRRDRAVGGTALNETRYILMDYFSPAAITDGSGAVKERYQFSAFGLRTILNPDYTPRTNSECGMAFSFQGHFEDAETGWMNYGYRYYLPSLGRWACKDPIEEEGGWNVYQMVGNNAVSKVDLFGLADSDNTCPTSDKGKDNGGDKGGKSKGGVKAPPKPKGHKGFHHYGNWGGPGWADGGWNSENGLLPPYNESTPPVDERDKCYKDHDYCIAECVTGEDCPCPEDKKKVSDCIEKCDHALADCLRDAGVKGMEPWMLHTMIPWLVH